MFNYIYKFKHLLKLQNNIEEWYKMVTMRSVTNETVTIRKAVKADAVSIASIHSNTWRVAYKGIVPLDVLDKMSFNNRLEYFRGILETDEEETVVAMVKNLVVGFMTFGKSRDEDLGSENAEVWGIYIDVSYFNKGIGTSLMNWVEDEFTSRGFRSVYLWTLEDNLRATMFYTSLGYRRDGKTKNLMGDTTMKAIRYYKEIDVL